MTIESDELELNLTWTIESKHLESNEKRGEEGMKEGTPFKVHTSYELPIVMVYILFLNFNLSQFQKTKNCEIKNMLFLITNLSNFYSTKYAVCKLQVTRKTR